MKLYAAMNRLFRRSYALKLFAVAFVGTHIPLLALLGWSLWRGHHWRLRIGRLCSDHVLRTNCKSGCLLLLSTALRLFCCD